MVVEYGNKNNKDPVIARIGDRDYQLEFHTLTTKETYFFFEDEESKRQFVKKFNEGGNELPMSKNFHIHKKRIVTKLAIKLIVFKANYCPGSCMFGFLIYRVGKGRVCGPDLYIYTGDYCLSDKVKKELINLRKKENVETVTIINDNTRTDDKDYGLFNYRAVINRIKKFIDVYVGNCNTPITVKIGGDWGMEVLWKKLARKYNTRLQCSEYIENAIGFCRGKKYLLPIEETSKEKDGDSEDTSEEEDRKNNDSNNMVMYVINTEYKY